MAARSSGFGCRPAHRSRGHRDTRLIFLVDDDAGIRKALVRLLSSAGHAVEAFASPREFLARETARDEWTVHVRPQLVVEIAFNDVQESPHYPAGMALRFARVKGYRPDKRPEEADTIDTVRSIYQRSLS